MTEILERVIAAICCAECHENGLAFEQILFGKDIEAIARAAIVAYEAAKREATPSEAASDAGLNWAKPL